MCKLKLKRNLSGTSEREKKLSRQPHQLRMAATSGFLTVSCYDHASCVYSIVHYNLERHEIITLARSHCTSLTVWRKACVQNSRSHITWLDRLVRNWVWHGSLSCCAQDKTYSMYNKTCSIHSCHSVSFPVTSIWCMHLIILPGIWIMTLQMLWEYLYKWMSPVWVYNSPLKKQSPV